MNALTIYSQKDPRWGSLEIIKGLKMSNYGCVITSIACLDGRTPDVILGLLQKAKAIDKLGRVIWQVASLALDCLWGGITSTKPKYPCIAMTNYYKSKGFPTHFFVALNNEEKIIIDPLTGKKEVNKYPIVSYRLFYKDLKYNGKTLPA